MYINRKNINIDEELFNNEKKIFDIFLFFVKVIFIRAFLFLTILFSFSLTVINLNRGFWSYSSYVLMIFIAFVISISIVLEEYFHTFYFIYINKSNLIKGLTIERIGLNEQIYVIFGVRVFFKGKITSNDMFYTSLAGPLLTIFYKFIFWLFIFLIVLIFQNYISSFYRNCLIVIFTSSIILPILSLLPIKMLTLESDGWKIIKMVLKNKISFKEIILCVLTIIKISIFLLRKGLKVE